MRFLSIGWAALLIAGGLLLVKGYDAAKHDDSLVVRGWVKASAAFDDLVWPQKRFVGQLLTDVVKDADLGLSKECISALNLLKEGIKKRSLWAYYFLDSSAKGKSGFAYGVIGDIGNYDECIGINATDKGLNIKGQYCLIQVNFPLGDKPEGNVKWYQTMRLNVSGSELKGTVYETYADHVELFYQDAFNFALCVPSSCSPTEVQDVINKYLRGTELEAKVKPFCETQATSQSPLASYPVTVQVSVYILAGFALFVLLATVRSTKYGTTSGFLGHFCASKNTDLLFAESEAPGAERLAFMDGYRVMFSVGAICGHFLASQGLYPALYAVLAESHFPWLMAEYIKRAFYGCQIMLMGSGLFTAYSVYPAIVEAKGQLSFVKFVFKKWLRATPALIGAILLTFAGSTLGSGPLFKHYVDRYVGNCYESWWKTLLFVNNFQKATDICVLQTWFLSVDFQCHVLSYFILIQLYKNPTKGVFSAFGLIVSGMAMSSLVVFYYDLPAHQYTSASLPYQEMVYPLFHRGYENLIDFNTYNNVPSYFVGILFGYLMVTDKKLPEALWYPVWAIACGAFWHCLLYPYFWELGLNLTPHRLIEALYASYFRLGIAILFGYNGYAFYNGKSGIVKKLFSFKAYRPLSRMTYSVFLVNFAYIWYDITNGQEYMPTRTHSLVMRMVYTIVMCWFLGYFLYILIEAPFNSIARSLFDSGSKVRVKPIPDPEPDGNRLSDKKGA